MIDDDATVAQVVVAYLERAGVVAEHAADGPAALAAAAAHPPDAVVLDLMLPGIDGLEVCRRLRTARADLPVLMLTARGEEEDRVLGLQIGADDYVVKPFSPRELVLRVQSLLRRAGAAVGPAASASEAPAAPLPAGGSAPAQRAAEALHDGDLRLDPTAHRVVRSGTELQLTVREFELLRWFLTHPGQVHDREALMRGVWGWEHGDRSTVTVHVRRLREKVEADPSRPTRLVTVFGVGYRWDPTPSAPAPSAPGPSAPGPRGDA
ncbi:DNA-binding response regulator, OmpR family, contains REC and winged-helix (wHTH) domain [Promicromonospora umidemergens]|uniref:Response regulator transcription factor n=1 Tax=Promicromonospora umidemergens TaxID=629679 RepID=A0ABP8WLM6_9MICO|nr:DNA-binding response regulator, OmpR family, contains REC and winged-helix (wHTH) domain [Promicromonospora umidemergens]